MHPSFSNGFPMVFAPFPATASAPESASTSVRTRLRHSPGRVAACPDPRQATQRGKGERVPAGKLAIEHGHCP